MLDIAGLHFLLTGAWKDPQMLKSSVKNLDLCYTENPQIGEFVSNKNRILAAVQLQTLLHEWAFKQWK